MRTKIKYVFAFVVIALCMAYSRVDGQTVGFAESVVNFTPSRSYPMWTQLPEGYTTSKKYPLIVFIHGLGEASGTSETDPGFVAGDYLYKIYTNAQSLPYFRENGWNGKAWNPATGDSTGFIIISPQYGGWTPANNVHYFIRYAVNTYSVDTNKIYVTGFSNGGRFSWRYSKGDANAAAVPSQSVPPSARPWIPAAAVMMSVADDYPVQIEADRIVSDKIPIWNFGSPDGDNYGKVTDSIYQKVYRLRPDADSTRWTQYTGGHCCWGQFYTPTYKEKIGSDSMNVYSWMLQFSRQSETPAGAPTVDVGVDRNISKDTVTVSGVATPASGKTISSYQWTKISGTGGTIVSPTSATTQISGLSSGTYVYRLTVTQSDAQTAYDELTINATIAPVASGCTVIWTTATQDGNISTISNNFVPGDTICITAGTYKRINIENVKGTQAKPIIFKNYNGQVVVSSAEAKGMLRIANSQYVHLTGTGSADFYGIRTKGFQGQLTSSAISVQSTGADSVGHIEIDHLWGDSCTGFGMQVKTNPQDYYRNTWHPFGRIPDINIHDTKMTNTGSEGYYIGYTNFNITVKTRDAGNNPVDTIVDAIRIVGLKFHHNISENTGWDGIQIATSDSVDVHDNTVRNYGLTNTSGQSDGMLFGARSFGKVYNNWIENGASTGLRFFGYNDGHLPSRIYNNVIINAGLDGFAGQPLTNNGKYMHQSYYFTNNTIVSPARIGVLLYNQNNDAGLDSIRVNNNLIVNPGTVYIDWNQDVMSKSDTTQNARLASPDFQSGTYKLNSSSGAYNMSGKDYSAIYTDDYEHASRNGVYGMGAYTTFQSGSPVVSTSPSEINTTNIFATLSGSATPASGKSISSYQWTKLTGGSATIESPTSASTTVSGLQPGTYTFRLTATQSDGITSHADVTVNVTVDGNQPVIIRDFMILKRRK